MMMTKKRKSEEEKAKDEELRNDTKRKNITTEPPPVVVMLGEDLVFEVLRHADARTLARAACVSRQWRRTAEDERLWEGVCTRHWTHMGCSVGQLRSVVLALGGFRRLHSLCLLPLLHHPSNSLKYSSSLLPIMPFSSSSSSAAAAPSSSVGAQKKARWGKDEVNLSLSLLSIQHYYEKMGMGNRGGGGGWRSSS